MGHALLVLLQGLSVLKSGEIRSQVEVNSGSLLIHSPGEGNLHILEGSGTIRTRSEDDLSAAGGSGDRRIVPAGIITSDVSYKTVGVGAGNVLGVAGSGDLERASHSGNDLIVVALDVHHIIGGVA